MSLGTSDILKVFGNLCALFWRAITIVPTGDTSAAFNAKDCTAVGTHATVQRPVRVDQPLRIWDGARARAYPGQTLEETFADAFFTLKV